jgi:amino acid transporter
MEQMQTQPPRSGLRANCLPFSEVLAQSIANVAPTGTPAVTAALVFTTAGNGTWLTYLLAMMGLVFVSLNTNQFASRSASPGSLYAYIARGLGPLAGVITGWALILAYVFTAMAAASAFSNYSLALLQPLGIQPAALFLLAICIGTAWYLAHRDIQLSTVLMLAIEAASVGLVLILGLIVLGHKGYVLDPAQLSLQGVQPNNIVLGLVLGIFSFVGFESATTLGDESERPLRNIPRAVLSSTIACGLFFAVIAYIETIGFRGEAITFAKSAAPLNDLAKFAGVGFFGVLVSLGASITMFACTLASLNAGARICFSMGRHGVFHHSVGRAHRAHKTPHIAVALTALVAFLTPATMSLFSLKLLDIYAYTGILATFGFLVAYILISIAAPVYLHREHQLRPLNLAYSIFGVGVMLIPVLGSIGLPGENSFFPVPPAPYNVFPYLFLLYLLVGAGWFLVLRLRKPELIAQMEADIEASHARYAPFVDRG